ncbi:diacylglycerol kinase [Elusimicrobium simillimum]|uniref:hypothetical protein n=1 Tax=Elusimicrobium simillimum TaxID=3143438 RepID=UPI003C70312E
MDKLNTTPVTEAAAPQVNLFYKIIQTFAKHLVTVVLPYIFGSMGVFFIGVMFVYKFGITPLEIAAGFKLCMLAVLCVFYLPFSFVYGILMAGLSTLVAIAGVLEGVITDFVDRLKATVERHVSSMDDGLPKTQAKIILNASIKEVVQTYKDNKSSSAAKAISIFILSFIIYAVRIVLFGKVKQATGAEVSLGLIFAGKAALVGAVFFNLKLVAKFVLALGYLFGLIFLGVQILLLIIL